MKTDPDVQKIVDAVTKDKDVVLVTAMICRENGIQVLVVEGCGDHDTGALVHATCEMASRSAEFGARWRESMTMSLIGGTWEKDGSSLRKLGSMLSQRIDDVYERGLFIEAIEKAVKIIQQRD